MKKFLLFALCVIASVSAFAEAFSKAKYDQFLKDKNYTKWSEYCYNTQISTDCQYQMQGYVYYLYKHQVSKEQGLKQLEKFKSKVSEQAYNKNVALFLIRIGFVQEGIKIADCLQTQYIAFENCLKNKNKDMMWKYGKMVLLSEGGFKNIQTATTVLTHMFRYKPESITKEQQIEFLNKLVEIYPIPGTDFNQWKGFMGFVGFKYKALTGKELF